MSKEEIKPVHETRLATTDEGGWRVYIFPEVVKGIWHKRRVVFQWFLIAIYLILPWIYVDGKQWVLLNIAKREFTIFGKQFYAHDGPMLLFVVLGFAFLIGFITSVWGRVWCGWACPQTVFIDSVFRKIEELVMGNARKRKALHKAPMSKEKVFKNALKWILFTIASLHIVHSFLGYFVGTHKLFWITMSPPTEHLSLFFGMLFLTGLTLFDFGWFREQFCIIACPYGRFQSVLMDEHSLLVGYDYNRGEPRRNVAPDTKSEGDCIDCKKCIKVCPTGIDIRQGTQLECIACTQCIDACDEIMTKIKKPTGLIRYTTESALEKKPQSPFKKVRPYVYLFGLTLLAIGFSFTLNKREGIAAQLVRGSQKAYQIINPQTISNHFKIKMTNNTGALQKIEFQLHSDTYPENELKRFEIIIPQLLGEEEETSFFTFKEGRGEVDYFIQFPKELLKDGKAYLQVRIVNDKGEVFQEKVLKLVGPF